MHHQQTVRYALMCLKALDATPEEALSIRDIAREQGVPMTECEVIVRRLRIAGLVRQQDRGRYRLTRPLWALSAADVLNALRDPERRAPPVFALLFSGGERMTGRATRRFAAWGQATGIQPIG